MSATRFAWLGRYTSFLVHFDLYFFGALGGAGGGAEGRMLAGAGGLTFSPSLPVRCSNTWCLGLFSLFTSDLLL